MSKCISNLGEYSEHTVTHGPECLYCGDIPETRFDSMRAVLVAIQELHKPKSHVCECGESHGQYCKNCQADYPCDTRKLADEALGGGERA